MRLTTAGAALVTRESLSELTTAVAMSRCDDKRVTRRLLSLRGTAGAARAGPRSATSTTRSSCAEVGTVVVKPARGSRAVGISIGVSTPEQLRTAIAEAHRYCPDVLLEEFVAGEDLRVVVIDDEVVAAAVRRPATVIGDRPSTRSAR